jgi:hypothetical protein
MMMRGDLKIYLKRLLTTVRNVETEAVAQTFERTFVFALSREACFITVKPQNRKTASIYE